jgi:hypothetical protein
MAYKLPFPNNSIVLPVVCTVCGKNAMCIDRQPDGLGESQTFLCACGNVETRIRLNEPSDASIQREVEQRIQGGRI